MIRRLRIEPRGVAKSVCRWHVGCRGGLLLRDALASGAAVTGLDHSHLHHFPGVVRHAGRTRAVASRGLFYEDEELAELVRRAGLAAVVVVNDDGGQLLGARAQRPRPT